MTNKTFNFEAETGQILELLTHSIYSNKEIFLRELVSNASDAIDKARIRSLTDTAYLGDNSEFKIQIDVDTKASTITITDNGIGMTEEEVHTHIGTIAKSGTKDFIEKMKEAKEQADNTLIGQFGVGFYSAFIVADSVTLETKSADSDKAVIWESDGKGSYEIKDGSKTERGTTITLHVNKDQKEFVDEVKLKGLIKKYSNYVAVPIMMLEIENPDKKEEKRNYEQVNETKSIWTKNKSDVTPEEYTEFYKTLAYDFNAPLDHVHLNIEGAINYKALLYVPEKVSMTGAHEDARAEYGPKLYVQNVLILENAKELLPVWLRFVSWVVETNDLPLNISREMLQSNVVLDKIKAGLTKKVLTKLASLAKKWDEKYDEFLSHYSKILKEGIYSDPDNKEKIAEIVKFKSLLKGSNITLDEYLENSKEEKKTIYYITGRSESEALANPYLEQFREKNIDVLVMTDPIDEWAVQSLTEYKEAKLISATSSKVELDGEKTEEKKKQEEKTTENFKDLLELIKKTVGEDKLEEVKVTDRLGNSLSALSTAEGGMTPGMEKMYRAMGQDFPVVKRILEINPENKLVKSMLEEFKSSATSEKLQDLIHYSYEQALLAEWGEIENISEFIARTNKFAGTYL